MNIREKALEAHEKWQGKLSVETKSKLNCSEDLAIAYTPGVAEPCKEIHKDAENAYKYTMKANTVAVISDGSAVLGLGNIGPLAAMPVMEGKCAIFKEFAGVNAIPLCLDTQDTDELVNIISALAPSFGGINLEDISAPRCFEIEARLKEQLDIPVFHDDQHGTAIVVLAAILNAIKVAKKEISKTKVVINGCGSAGTAIGKLLLEAGFKNLIMVDINGIVAKGEKWLNWAQKEIAEISNPENITGTLKEALVEADVFIGVSAPNIVTKEMIKSMNEKAIVFAMANPVPEIMPKDALEAGAYIVGSGRSDFENQVNNVLAFPGIFKGALESRCSAITEEMKLACAYALADFVSEDKLARDYVLPRAFEEGIADVVALAIKKCVKK